MAPDNNTGEPNRQRLSEVRQQVEGTKKIKIVISLLVVFIIAVAVVAIVVFKQVLLPKFEARSASATEQPASTVQQIDIGQSVNLPVYPGAIAVAPPDDVPATDTRTFFATPDDGETVATWYRNELSKAGYTEIDSYYEGDVKVIRFEDDRTDVDLFTTNIDGGTGFSLIATTLRGTSSEVNSPAIGATPDITPPTPTVVTGGGGSDIPVPFQAPPVTATVTGAVPSATVMTDTAFAEPPLNLEITATVPALQSGTLTRYSYDVRVTSHTTATLTSTVTVEVSVGITLLSDLSGGYGEAPEPIAYNPADRTVTYTSPLAPGQQRRVTLTVVTDMFIKPGELRLKGYVSSPGIETQLAVQSLTVAKQ